MGSEPLVNERILNGFAAILRRLEDIKEAVENVGEPATTEADLQAEAETCGRSASEPESPCCDPAAPDSFEVTIEETPDEPCDHQISEFVADALRDGGFTAIWLMDKLRPRLAAAHDPWEFDVAGEILDKAQAALAGSLMVAPEPLMPAIEAGLEARVRRRWPRLVISHEVHPTLNDIFSVREYLRGPSMYCNHQWPGIIDWLESECPEPSEGVERRAMWDHCGGCVSLSASIREEPCKSCVVDKPPSNFEPKE